MKCTIPEISWHNREPVLSIHIQPVSEKFYRLATGGADCHVLIWQLIISDNGAVKLEALSDLTRHQRAVNTVRWSPNGQHLASGDDDANIIVWQLKTDNIPLLEGETNDKETWIVHKVLRGHKEDIYDLCWSPSGLKLLSGSVDNTAILWDLNKGKMEQILTDHKGFVQGVAWDPKGHYLATISTDRICRIYESSGRQVRSRIQRGCLPVPKEHYLYNKDVKYFHDDTFKSFFRRLDFSPDGSLLAVPSGRIEIEDCKKILNGTLVFAVESWTEPVAVLPTGKQCSTVVRFCPIVFGLHENGPDPLIALPFRMIMAVGTDHDVILYDTQQPQPFAYFKDIHYTRLTDLTWSDDGLLLVASSTDGYCALITFEPNELGKQYVKEESEVEESVLEISGCEELEKEDNVEFVKPKKPNLLEQWTVKTPKKCKNETSSASNNEGTDEDTSKRKRDNETAKNTVKRIKPIPVEQKKEGENTTNKKPGPSPKASPLLNFLKKATKEKFEKPKKELVTSPPIISTDLTLDENEARDAWKCDKNDEKNTETKIIDMDEYTEDFSLHLEDTNPENSTNDIKKSDDINTEITVPSGNCIIEIKENIDTAAKQVSELNEEICKSKDDKVKNCNETAEVNKTLNTESEKDKNCVHVDTKTKQNTVPLEVEKVSKTQTVVTADDKVNISKRRIPLITLSSPKHKKK